MEDNPPYLILEPKIPSDSGETYSLPATKCENIKNQVKSINKLQSCRINSPTSKMYVQIKSTKRHKVLGPLGVSPVLSGVQNKLN